MWLTNPCPVQPAEMAAVQMAVDQIVVVAAGPIAVVVVHIVHRVVAREVAVAVATGAVVDRS